MTEGLMPKQLTDALRPDLVAPFVAYLCHDSCAVTGSLFEVGGGWVAQTRWQRTQGATFSTDGYSIEEVAQNWNHITDWTDATNPVFGDTVFAPMMQHLGVG
jgi:3-hydroxyacyl-CoA dehydrogenase/3a,7a,12a-trihydroxy-5b-cholest-24-enoyl-CoA hydratase